MRLVLITGNQPRHLWLADQLQQARPRWAISTFCDGARPTPVDQLRVEAEVLGYGFTAPEPPCAWHGQPDLVLFYGCHLIDVTPFTCPVLNLHMGLSPWYRGSNTNSWALHNGEPEAVGATLHLATNRVDHGAIIKQIRPTLKAADTLHHVGARTLKAAAKALPDALDAFHRPFGAQALTQPDATKGRLYKRQEWTDQAKAHTEHLIANGLITDYLTNQPARDARYPLV